MNKMKYKSCALVLTLYSFIACNSQEYFSNLHRSKRYKTGLMAAIKGISAKHILKSTYSSDAFDCMADCLSHPTCQAINFQTKGNSKHLCELSKTAIISSPTCQEVRSGFIFFYPIQEPFINCTVDGMKCKNGGKCLDLGCGGYVCECQPFNTGKYCEQWTTEIISCKDILSKTSYRENRAYTFYIGYEETTVYCHLTREICGDGGWTLTMKIDGSTMAQFGFNAPLWSNKEPYNLTAGQTGFDNYQTKMPSYWAIPFDKLCVGFKVNNHLKWIVIPYKASSLYDVIADGHHRVTSVGKNKWMSLISGASLQSNCNQEGFNNHNYARLGIRANQENDCHSCDSAIGLGLNRHYSCGNYCGSSYCSHGNKQIVAFGYLMVQ